MLTYQAKSNILPGDIFKFGLTKSLKHMIQYHSNS